jgi:Rod binding domain-containing protein
LLRQILSATQKTVINSKFADNSTASEIYRDMITTQLSDSISKSGSFGLAQTFERQLTRPAPTGVLPGAAANLNPLHHSKDHSEQVTPGVRPLGHGKDLHHAHE